jgi:hypothetical protein
VNQLLGFSRSRRRSSASTASRMNCAMRFGPATASMRAIWSNVNRTFVSFTPSGGRPMRLPLTVPGIFVKAASNNRPRLLTP